MGNRVDRLMFSLVVLVALSVWGAAIASSQTLSLDDQSAMEVEDSVTFTLSLDNPSDGQDIGSLTIDVSFDATVLSYDDHTPGSLVQSWGFFDVNSPESGLLKIAGFNLQGIPAGTSGAVVELHFTVASENNDTLMITSLDGFDTEDGEFTFELPPPNNPPMAVDDMGTTVEGQSVTINVLDNDTDDDSGDTLTITAVTQGVSGTVVSNNDGTVTYMPNAGFTGSDDFTYTVSDGMDEGTAMVTVTVTAPPEPPNTAPTAANDTAMTDEGEAVVIDVLDNDSDDPGDTLAVTAVTQGAYGAVVNNNDGTVTYTPDEDFSGMDSFMYTVSDGELDATATVSVTVEAAEVVEPGDGDGDGGTSGGGGGGCTLNPGAPFDPTLLSVLALFMGIHFVRRFTRRQSLR